MKRAIFGSALAFALMAACAAAFAQTQAPYVDGAGPDPAGTACPGESRAATVAVRRDGNVAVLIPASADIDPELHRVLAAYGHTGIRWRSIGQFPDARTSRISMRWRSTRIAALSSEPTSASRRGLRGRFTDGR